MIYPLYVDGQNIAISRRSGQRLLKVEGIPEETWEMKVVNYVEQNYGFKSEDFEKVWNKFLYDVKDLHFMKTICEQIDEPRKKKQIEFKIDKLYS